MASKKKGTKAKASKAVVTKVISVPAGTKEIVLHIRIGKGASGGPMKLMMAAAKSPIEPDPTDDG